MAWYSNIAGTFLDFFQIGRDKVNRSKGTGPNYYELPDKGGENAMLLAATEADTGVAIVVDGAQSYGPVTPAMLEQAWTHPSLGAPIGAFLFYAGLARDTDPPDTFAFWATETNEASTDALVTITGTGYLGFDLVNSDRARENLGLGELATKDTVDVLSPIVFGAASDNGISTGVKRTVYFPKERTITGWHIGADTIGDIALQLWVSSSYAPIITDNIVGTCGVTAEQYASGNVSDWAAVTIPAGSWVSFVVATVSNINRFDVTFEVTP